MSSPSQPRLQQPFSQQKGGQRARNLKQFKDALNALSGNEPVALISAYLQTPSGRALLPQLWQQLEGNKLSTIISKVLEQHKQAPKEERKLWLSILASVFTREELNNLGFSFSTQQFTKARSQPLEVQRSTTGKRKRSNSIDADLQELIKQHGYQHSTPAPNRTVKLPSSDPENKKQKVVVPVRYLEDSVRALYTDFVRTHPDEKVCYFF
jgi:hypothetical protein